MAKVTNTIDEFRDLVELLLKRIMKEISNQITISNAMFETFETCL